jgi:hypothetical protein
MTNKYCHKIGIANDLEFWIVAKSNLHYYIVAKIFSIDQWASKAISNAKWHLKGVNQKMESPFQS